MTPGTREEEHIVEIHSKGFVRPHLRCDPRLAAQWRELLESAGFRLSDGPTGLELYREAYAKGIPQEFGIPPPSEAEFEGRHNYLCCWEDVTLLMFTTTDDSGVVVNLHKHRSGTSEIDWLDVATHVEAILFANGATRWFPDEQ